MQCGDLQLGFDSKAGGGRPTAATVPLKSEFLEWFVGNIYLSIPANLHITHPLNSKPLRTPKGSSPLFISLASPHLSLHGHS
jgi:hypothetical protein